MTAKHAFTFQSGTREVTHTVTSEGLGDIIEAFEDYLKGCGFVLNGSLQIELYREEDDA